MKISLNWLKEYIETDLSVEKIAEILTDTGLEVEGFEKVESIKGGLEGVVVGEVKTKEKHPDADRLNVTTVDVGTGELLQIVCGAPNVETGQKVLVATSGTTLYPNPEEPFKIKKSKIRGVESNGMICAEDELGVGTSHDGIMILADETKVGLPAKEYFNINDDYIIEIGLTPNRTDGMGHIGVARDLKAFLNTHKGKNIQLKLPEIYSDNPNGSAVKIQLENPEACPRYAGAVIKGVEIADSPDWLQDRLRVIGLKPINNIVDITNYVMHETSNPLHAFDLGKVGDKVVIRNANKGEKLVTLDEIERELDPEDLMICNSTQPMCIAGTFGGIDSGVSNLTVDIFLESAYFNPVSVRKTAKRHQLNTDSSFRFERGVDPNNIDFALRRAIYLIQSIAGGELISLEDIYPNKIEPLKVEFSYDSCRKITGTTIENIEIDLILKELDMEVEPISEGRSLITIPTYRADVTREADVIEEVLRIYGFNLVPIPEKLNSSISYQEKPNKEKLYNTIADLLVNNGFYEILNNSLSSSGVWNTIKSQTYNSQEDVQLLNPLSNELDVMRQTLMFSGLKSIAFNYKRQHPDLRFFEFGKTYKKQNGKYLETQHLSLFMTGQFLAENWDNDKKRMSFYHLKSAVESILTRLGLWKITQSESLVDDLFEDGYQITISKQSIGSIGWIKKDILSQFDIKAPVFYADLNWDHLVSAVKMNKIQYKPVPKTPFVRRDFSLLLDRSVKFDAIRELAQTADRKILKEVDLFDVYEGKNLEKGKKSYAVSFIFQDEDQTLKDKQVDAIMEKIRLSLEDQLGAELR